MKSLLILYNDEDLTHDRVMRTVSQDTIFKASVILIVDADNNVSVMKNRNGPVSDFEAKEIVLSVPNQFITLTS